MKKEWSHLPNARHIDRILASVKLHPDNWNAYWHVISVAASDAAWLTAYDAANYAARSTAMNASWDAVRRVVSAEARYAAVEASRDAILALIAWDEAGEYLNLSSEKVQVLSLLGDKKAILMRPAVMAFEQSMELV